MKLNRKLAITAVISAVVLPLTLIACDRELSSNSKSTTNADGSTKTKESTVTQSSTGAVTKEEKATSTPPTRP